MPSPDPQNTSGLFGQTPTNPQWPCWGCRAGPLFHVQCENHIAPPESAVRLSGGSSAPVPLNRPLQGGWGVWSPYSWNTPSGLTFLKRGTTTPSCQSSGTAPDDHVTLQLCHPYKIQGLKELWADLIHPRGPASEEFFNHLGNFSHGDNKVHPQVPRALLLHRKVCQWDWGGL